MELLQLQYFVITAKEQNMTRAAEMLHIAQPALSQSIKRLEEEMGVLLFDRVGKRIRLNDAGKELLRTTEPMLATLADLPQKLQAIAEEEAQTISLNVLVASRIATQLMIDYKAQHPKSSFKMDRNAESLDWDLRISAISGQGMIKPAKDTQLLMEEEIFLAVPAGSPFADRKEISLQEVSREPFLTFPASMPYHNLCNRMWGETGIHPRISLESDNPQTLKELLAAGMGVAFWPQFSWGKADKNEIRLLHLAEPKASRIVTITRNPKRQIAKAAEDFYRFSIAYFEKHGGFQKRYKTNEEEKSL